MASVDIAGNGFVKSVTRSQLPLVLKPSISSLAKRRMVGSQRRAAVGVNHGFNARRYSLNRGGSISIGIESRAPGGFAGTVTLWAEEKVPSSSATALTSSYFDSTQKPP